MLKQYGSALFFGLIGLALMYGAFILQKLISPHNPTPLKQETYECGEETVGMSWVQFNIRFYVIALIFLIFDVELVFLMPWAVVFRDLGLITFLEVFIFLAILIAGLAYAWRKGDLEWVKMQVKYPPRGAEKERLW